MNKRKIGKLVLDITADEKNWYSEIKPILLATTALEYMKLAMLAAEVQKYIQDQIIILNVDEGGKLAKLAKRLFNQDTDGNLLVPKPEPDTEKYQQPLPFDEVTSNDTNNT